MTNFMMLDAATALLGDEDKRRFEDFFIGSLAVNVPPEIWASAIADASVCLTEECSTDRHALHSSGTC
jgi:hypothetical protein